MHHSSSIKVFNSDVLLWECLHDERVVICLDIERRIMVWIRAVSFTVHSMRWSLHMLKVRPIYWSRVQTGTKGTPSFTHNDNWQLGACLVLTTFNSIKLNHSHKIGLRNIFIEQSFHSLYWNILSYTDITAHCVGGSTALRERERERERERFFPRFFCIEIFSNCD